MTKAARMGGFFCILQGVPTPARRKTKERGHPFGCPLCVGVTYFPGRVGLPSIAARHELNSFEAIAVTVAEGCFNQYDPYRFPELYDTVTAQDLLDFIRENIVEERMALSIIDPKEEQNDENHD